MDRLRELVRLHRMGTGAREVARLLGMGPNTERAYRAALVRAGALEGPADEVPQLEVLKALVQEHLPSQVSPQQTSSLVPWQGRVEGLLSQGLGPRAIHDRLRLEVEGFTASASAVWSCVGFIALPHIVWRSSGEPRDRCNSRARPPSSASPRTDRAPLSCPAS